MYGVGGDPPVRGVLHFAKQYTTVDYPPVALYELAAVGAVYRETFPSCGRSSARSASSARST